MRTKFMVDNTDGAVSVIGGDNVTLSSSPSICTRGLVSALDISVEDVSKISSFEVSEKNPKRKGWRKVEICKRRATTEALYPLPYRITVNTHSLLQVPSFVVGEKLFGPEAKGIEFGYENARNFWLKINYKG